MIFISLSLFRVCYVPCGMWDLSFQPRIEPVPLQWECRLLTTGPSGKSLPLVLDFDQMKYSLQASKFRSSPLPPFFLQKCFHIVVPGRVDICVSSAHFDLSVFHLSGPVPVSVTFQTPGSHRASCALMLMVSVSGKTPRAACGLPSWCRGRRKTHRAFIYLLI